MPFRERPQATTDSKIVLGFTCVNACRHQSLTVAHSFCQTTENHGVGGSIPPLGTNKINTLATVSILPKAPCPHCVRPRNAGTT